MGYLRGTAKASGSGTTWHTRTRAKKSVQQEIAALKRKVSRNSPETYSFRQSTQFNAPAVAGAYALNTLNITNNFVTSATYHDNVTGDWFMNKSLDLNFTIVADTLRFRVVVYIPRRVGTSFAPALSAGGFVSHPDYAAFKVLKDITSDPIESNSPRSLSLHVPLRYMKTCFDTDTNLIEQSEVKVCLLYQSNTLSGSVVMTTVGTMLTVCDK